MVRSKGALAVTLSAAIFLALFLTASAQEQSTGLKKTADGRFEHEASKTGFTVPKGWETLPPDMVARTAVLGLRQGRAEAAPGIEVTLFWSPLNVTFEEAANLEQSLFGMLYGSDKVKKPEPAKAGQKNGVKIAVDAGPSRDGKEAGVIYLFEAGSGNDKWKVKLRATFPKLTQAESEKAVEALLDNLKW